MVVSMKKAMFRYKMSLAGCMSDEQFDSVARWVEKHEDINHPRLRDAIYEYAKICTDLSMVPAYIKLVDKTCYESRLNYLESAKFVSMVIAGWCT